MRAILLSFVISQTTECNEEGQFTIKWNDPDYRIFWPVEDPILSAEETNK